MKVSLDAAVPVANEAENPTNTSSSGIYLASHERTAVAANVPHLPSADSPAPHGTLQRARLFATTHLRALTPLAVLALYDVRHTPVTLLLVALSPLLLFIGGDRSGKWAMRAAAWWLLLAAAGLVYGAGSELHRGASILVLAFVLARLQRAYAAVREQSRRDALTGLLNRRGFEEAATRELNRASRYARPLAFALLDVDRFKDANDRFGHNFGDLVLKTLAEELGRLRGSDLAVRLGGDEFGVLMPETDYAAARLLLDRLRQSVYEHTVHTGWAVTLSVGIVDLTMLQQEASIEALMLEADRRMYRAKRDSNRPRSQPQPASSAALRSSSQ